MSEHDKIDARMTKCAADNEDLPDDEAKAAMVNEIIKIKDEAVREAIQKCESIIEYSVDSKHDREKCIARIREGHEQHTNAGGN